MTATKTTASPSATPKADTMATPATLTIGQIAAAVGVPAPKISHHIYRETVPGLSPATCPVGPDRKRMVPASLVPAIGEYFCDLAEVRAARGENQEGV
jgi:hypothetical protein